MPETPRQFWQQYHDCLVQQADLIETHHLKGGQEPQRSFGPEDGRPAETRRFWENLRRNILSQAAVIREAHIGGASTVRLPKRRRGGRPPRLDGRPGER